MSVHRKGSKWVVRYRDDAQRNRSRSFDRKADASHFDREASRRRQLGVVASLDAGHETLDQFVTETWAPTHAVTVSAKTRKHYSSLYDFHIAPYPATSRCRSCAPSSSPAGRPTASTPAAAASPSPRR